MSLSNLQTPVGVGGTGPGDMAGERYPYNIVTSPDGDTKPSLSFRCGERSEAQPECYVDNVYTERSSGSRRKACWYMGARLRCGAQFWQMETGVLTVYHQESAARALSAPRNLLFPRGSVAKVSQGEMFLWSPLSQF
ncbi:hypothetical protein E2C01_024404 [Portunus trituberculatus]|uniref:Uncharacterized protein n=1 Tax=Portunus trituberculatus TaxID=210409 RepID=A0A5B7ECL6_PORTR|nr:hypothetical protein [Portunus trituberculatus]